MKKKHKKPDYSPPALLLIDIELEDIIANSNKNPVDIGDDTTFGQESGFKGGRSSQYRHSWDNEL